MTERIAREDVLMKVSWKWTLGTGLLFSAAVGSAGAARADTPRRPARPAK